jgi:hypothetical protein
MAKNTALLPNIKEDHQSSITITGQDGIKLDNLRCKFYLPEKPTGKVSMYILPTFEQSRFIDAAYSKLWKFSFVADQPAVVGESERRLRISADEVYSLGISTRMWSPEMAEVVWQAEPTDLKIVHTLEPGSHPTEARFWLTPSSLLTPSATISRSYTGSVEVKQIREKRFELSNALSLNFTKHYRSREQDDRSNVTWSYLVAESKLWDRPDGSTIIDDELLERIDDFLLITSLATREYCVCVGWEVYDQIGHTVFYRRRISIPKDEGRHDFNDDLIDAQFHDEFVRTVYPQFAHDPSIELVRDSIRTALPQHGTMLESRFTGLFSAIETLVLSFRRQHGLEFVFNNKEDVAKWKRIKDGSLRDWLKALPLLSGNERAEQRKLIYENLSALERISFGHAFRRFCEFYSVDLADLWSISGGSDKRWSLTTIRNKLVHGEVFPSYKIGALHAATQHLQWTLERLILGYFGWSVTKSNVNPAYLSQFLNAHKEMETEGKIISS